MPQKSTNSQVRKNEKVVVSIKLKGAIPVDHTETTVSAWFNDDINNSTYLKTLSGFTVVPAPVTAEKDTEGVAPTIAVDVPTTWTILKQTPEDIANLIETFSNVKCDIGLLYCNPDVAIGAEPLFPITVTAGDRYQILRNHEPYINEVPADGTDYKCSMTSNKESASDERITVFHTVVADV